MKKVFSVYCLSVMLVCCSCSGAREDFSFAKDEVFPNVKCSQIDNLDLRIGKFQDVYSTILGFTAYRFEEVYDLRAVEGQNILLIDKSKDPTKYYELHHGILDAIKEYNQPKKTQALTNFLKSPLDELVFGVSSRSSYGKLNDGKTFFFYGFIYSTLKNEAYFIRAYKTRKE